MTLENLLQELKNWQVIFNESGIGKGFIRPKYQFYPATQVEHALQLLYTSNIERRNKPGNNNWFECLSSSIKPRRGSLKIKHLQCNICRCFFI